MAGNVEILKKGQQLAGKYRVGKPLSEGGYSVVYSAYRNEDQLPVAVKTLRANVEGHDPAAVNRFVREAAVAARLKHPNVVRVLDFGKTREDVLYMVMERLHGRPLSDIIHVEPMRPGRARQILRQVLSALAAAHEQGLVHRDLKPANVFLARVDTLMDDDLVDRVKILDFGFAKGLGETQQMLRQTLTLDGTRVGTPGYMAPEMLHPDKELTFKVDLYCVGLVGYEMLTGERAYPGTGIEPAIAQVRHDPKEPPSFISGHPLYQIVRTLIAREPDDRYPSAADALEALDALGNERGQ